MQLRPATAWLMRGSWSVGKDRRLCHAAGILSQPYDPLTLPLHKQRAIRVSQLTRDYAHQLRVENGLDWSAKASETNC